MTPQTLLTVALVLLVPISALAHPAKVHPPPGFRAVRASMYGNERTRAARRISSCHTTSGQPFRGNANAFAMTGALGGKYKVWTPGHPVTTIICNDTGANRPDLTYGLFHRMYYQLPSRHGGRRQSADDAGVMTVWMKRIGKVKFHHKH